MVNISRFFKRYVLLAVASLLLLALYIYQIQPTNAYLNMRPLPRDMVEVAGIWFLWIFVTAIALPSVLQRPSDCFLMSFALFVLLSGASLWGASGLMDIRGALILLGIFTLSMITYMVLIAAFSSLLLHRIRMVYFFRTPSYGWLLIVLLLVGVSVAVFSGQHGSFDLSTSYTRRLEGRENFPQGAITTYIFLMTLNGIAPFMAFLSSYKKKLVVAVFPALFSIYAYWLIGTKAPILMVGLMGLLGIYFRRKPNGRIPIRLLALVTFLFVIALLEYVLTGYSYISDYFVRRAFAVVAQLQGVYAGFAVDHFNLGNWIFGAAEIDGKPISRFLGEWYFLNSNTNANTNTLLYSLVQNGLAGWLLAILFIAAVFSLLNYIHEKRKTREAMGVAFLYALLLAEQAYSTAFLSSGIGLLLALMLCVRKSSVSHRSQEGVPSDESLVSRQESSIEGSS